MFAGDRDDVFGLFILRRVRLGGSWKAKKHSLYTSLMSPTVTITVFSTLSSNLLFVVDKKILLKDIRGRLLILFMTEKMLKGFFPAHIIQKAFTSKRGLAWIERILISGKSIFGLLKRHGHTWVN
ncbi:hypothetical protein EDC96DRAFT_541442 [Choanephora cucurbitarum]|nr:hypothetical protein EDC96DRAFT_541442 [Choanephora cucurbitarum]